MPTSQIISATVSQSFYQSSNYNTNVINRKNLRRYIAGPWGLGGLFTGTASDGSNVLQGMTKMVDQSSDGLVDIAYDSDRFENAWLMKLNTDETSETHRIASYSPSDGTVTIGRTFSTQPVSGTTEYEIHTHGVSPADINSAIDWACNTARMGAWVFLGGLIVDGDMQYSTVDAWTTNLATAVKATDVGSARHIKVAQSAAGGYARSTSFPVTALRSYRVYALGNPTAISDSISVSAWNETSNSAISVTWFGGASGTVEGKEGFFGGSFVAPVGCKSVHVRLVGNASWSGVAVYDNMSKGAPLPPWMIPYDQYIVAVAYLDGAGSAEAKEYRVIAGLPEPRSNWLEFEPSDWSGPICLSVSMPFPIPSDDAYEFPIGARDYIATGALRFIYTGLSRPRTIDTTRFEAGRVKVEREWQAYQRSRNPLALKRNSWGKR